MPVETRPFDPAEYLESEEDMAIYLTAALETGDATLVADALGVAARARGMSRIARDAGLSRESLYRALSSEGNPEFTTVVQVMKSLGLKLTAAPLHPAPEEVPRRKARKSA
jgi:probable addiction module antidote protein